MNNIYSKIKGIEARLNSLKAIGLTSASSISIAKKDITVQMQIVPLRVVSGEVLDCGSSKEVYIKITPLKNNVAFPVLYIKDTNSLYNERYIGVNLYYINGAYTYRIIAHGSDDDLRRLNNGEVLPVENYNFNVSCTSDFNYSIEYKDNDPWE